MFVVKWMKAYKPGKVASVITGIRKYATFDEALQQVSVWQNIFNNRYFIENEHYKPV